MAKKEGGGNSLAAQIDIFPRSFEFPPAVQPAIGEMCCYENKIRHLSSSEVEQFIREIKR